MKKLLFVAAVFFFLTSEARSQQVFHFGIKGGVNLTDLSSEYFAGHSMKAGFHVGVLGDVNFGNHFSVRPELLYSTAGADVKHLMLGGSPISEEVSLVYIQLPVLANFEVFPRFSLQVGPSFNFLVNEKSRTYQKDDLNDFEFRGALGVSYDLYSGLFVDLRYDHGLTDVFDETHSRNSEFQLGLGYMF